MSVSIAYAWDLSLHALELSSLLKIVNLTKEDPEMLRNKLSWRGTATLCNSTVLLHGQSKVLIGWSHGSTPLRVPGRADDCTSVMHMDRSKICYLHAIFGSESVCIFGIDLLFWTAVFFPKWPQLLKAMVQRDLDGRQGPDFFVVWFCRLYSEIQTKVWHCHSTSVIRTKSWYWHSSSSKVGTVNSTGHFKI